MEGDLVACDGVSLRGDFREVTAEFRSADG